MSYFINGYKDFYTVIENERKIGGVIEAEEVQLKNGEIYKNPVFTNIDYSGGIFYTAAIVANDGSHIIVHVNDISMIKSPAHKKIKDMKNHYFKEIKIKEKMRYLKCLAKGDQGAFTKPFVEEARLIIEDIGSDVLINEKQELSYEFMTMFNNKVVKIA
ncbi:hypothetical protein MM300_05080 [Evansella sp. LMS18]|uniref:hypothetical protein n=1 Tax=Evansella sp. LMS18 TaxID=2924033 RepID=UPI0020D1A8F5|nr:hypothetical protein [Evansella sp. LMS18]UTR11687.1 hypothetical protein MM300_05080 [Evansella sp. LMS18]